MPLVLLHSKLAVKTCKTKREEDSVEDCTKALHLDMVKPTACSEFSWYLGLWLLMRSMKKKQTVCIPTWPYSQGDCGSLFLIIYVFLSKLCKGREKSTHQQPWAWDLHMLFFIQKFIPKAKLSIDSMESTIFLGKFIDPLVSSDQNT